MGTRQRRSAFLLILDLQVGRQLLSDDCSEEIHKRYGELQLMRFEERELKPYAEPVPPEELKSGETYFAVFSLDDDGLVPTLEPLVFIGRDLDPGDEGKLYFQDYGSYRGGVRFETASPDDEAIFHTGREKGVYDYEHALDVLLVCALRRRKK